MAFCTNCGQELPDGAKFCSNCGTAVVQTPPKVQPERMQEFAGKIIKCPYCGEALDSFMTVCPACGHEIRQAESSSALKDFADRLSKTTNEKEKITIIRNFPIPNTKEDILEFSILASTNINENLNLDDEVSDAWFAKLGQAKQKAEVLFNEQPEYGRVAGLYDRVEKEVTKAKKASTFSNNININVIVATGWLVTIFLLIPFCQLLWQGGIARLLLCVDLALGLFLIPISCRKTSGAPKIIASIGLILSIVVMIPLTMMTDYEYNLVLLVDIVCSAIILAILFWRNKSLRIDSFSAKIIVVCLAICLGVFFIALGAASFMN